MKVYYVKDTRAGHDWLVQHGDRRYLASYSFRDARWSIRPFRDGGDRAPIGAKEAGQVLVALSDEKAARLLRWP